MNKHDLMRQTLLITALRRAKERAEKYHLYLSAYSDSILEVADAALVIEHIEIALGHLGVTDPSKEGGETHAH